ncbi:YicC/YloC family endoribonuclease [Shimia haliotis]|uniref:TIGR00255 family protein n=1 Tax=Shimia haliotis TaxID=1280847 RepID=A0A1I4AZU3_9RHOB|nr:YicC/YloC family endoribonuclease [Shimia haliotis]SFK61823.1 TIGR00255 family protein [Shimia haliotis]
MLHSMTGFAALKGEADGYTWAWDLRSVNAKGLDIRLRMPDWIEGLEPAVRAALSKALGRGSVNLNLRVNKGEDQGTLSVSPTNLQAAIDALQVVESAAMEQGIALQPSRAVDLMAVRGVLETTVTQTDNKALLSVLTAQLPSLISSFIEMREAEGQALLEVLSEQLVQIERLTVSASEAAEARREATAQTLKDNLARVMENTEGADEARVAQELAMIAVKSDVMEELDRLNAHVSAARDLLQTEGPVGRKLDFLMQEFNREANTLCSKAQSVDLTRIGLDLKAVIDQMREQVQNVE